MSDEVLWETLSSIAQSDGLVGRAHDMATAALSRRYVVDARVERKLASIIFEVYVSRRSEIDAQALAKAALTRWFQLCGPPLNASGGDETAIADSRFVDSTASTLPAE